LSERYNDFKNTGAQIIAINTEASAEQRDFRKTKNIEYLFLSDPDAAAVKKYGVFSDTDNTHIVPSTVIIDRRGIVRWKYVGKNPSDRPQPDVVLEALKKIR
jgi:peroxiredoxin